MGRGSEMDDGVMLVVINTTKTRIVLVLLESRQTKQLRVWQEEN